MEIALVIPAYNEEATIKSVLSDCLRFIKKIIVVNDCSTDSTKIILEKLPVILLNNQKNAGYTRTLDRGIKKAFELKSDYVITFDADGQHKANDLKKFISIINSRQPDLVLGKRFFKNRFMEQIFGLYSRIKYGFSDPLCGMKAYKKNIFSKYGSLETKYTISTELTFRSLKDGASFIEVPIQSEKRQTKSRFAGALKGNLLELKALINILLI